MNLVYIDLSPLGADAHHAGTLLVLGALFHFLLLQIHLTLNLFQV